MTNSCDCMLLGGQKRLWSEIKTHKQRKEDNSSGAQSSSVNRVRTSSFILIDILRESLCLYKGNYMHFLVLSHVCNVYDAYIWEQRACALQHVALFELCNIFVGNETDERLFIDTGISGTVVTGTKTLKIVAVAFLVYLHSKLKSKGMIP